MSKPTSRRSSTHSSGRRIKSGSLSRSWSAASGAPVETAPPNVPDNQPAFPQQTRAPGVHTQHRFVVQRVAGGLKLPWALAFLPDGRLLVTEKHAGKLVLLGAEGRRLAEVAGVPKVDGRGQGGLLDVALSPADPQRVFISYYEPRDGGNGLAVASARWLAGGTPRLEQLQGVLAAARRGRWSDGTRVAVRRGNDSGDWLAELDLVARHDRSPDRQATQRAVGGGRFDVDVPRTIRGLDRLHPV